MASGDWVVILMIDVSKFKVVYGDRVLNAISIECMEFKEDGYPELGKTVKPRALNVIAINEDGNVVVIRDEAWMFQFIPIVQKGV